MSATAATSAFRPCRLVYRNKRLLVVTSDDRLVATHKHIIPTEENATQYVNNRVRPHLQSGGQLDPSQWRRTVAGVRTDWVASFNGQCAAFSD